MKYTRLIVLFIALTLAACGPVRHVFPPSANIETLSTPADGEWTAVVRLHNQSWDAGVRFDALRLNLVLKGTEAAQLDKDIELDVAKRDSDIVSLRFQPTDEVRAMLARDPTGKLQYTLTGTITLSNAGEDPADYEVEHSAWLSPVPGRPEQYR